jgi:hypothetical protein
MTTQEIFEAHNKKLMQKLIPGDNEVILGRIIDPNDKVFHEPIKSKPCQEKATQSQ